MKTMFRLLLVFLTLAVGIPANAQYGSGKIAGKVIGRDGKPMANVTISIDRTDIPKHLEVKTDKNGSYFHGGIDKGTYRISVIENGIAVAAIDNLKLILDDRIDRDFDLRKPNQVGSASDIEAAEKALKEAEKFANTETRGAFNAGVAALEAKKLDEAIKQFLLAAERRPTFPVIYARLASVYVQAEKFGEATDAYQKASTLNPTDSGYVYNMGISACRANRIEDCRNAIMKASIMDPGLGSTANLNLGILLVSRGLYKEADEAFQTSIAFDPNNAETQYQVALLLVREQATIPQAVPYLEKVLSLAPNGPRAAEAKKMLDTVKPSARQ